MKKMLVTFTKSLGFFISWAILSSLIYYPSDNPVIWRFFAELIPLVIMLALTFIFLKMERGEVKLRLRQNFLKGSFIGLISGIVWLAIPMTILIAMGQFEIVEKNKVPFIGIWILSVFINVVMQEYLVRGYIYELLREKYNIKLAIIFTTALFTLLHGGAFEAGVIPVINVVTMCLFTTALFESEGTLMAPIMAHAIWNIVGSIIFGIVNLAEDYPSIYNVVASSNEILSGGSVKLEGSILVTIINIVLTIVFVRRTLEKKSIECNKEVSI